MARKSPLQKAHKYLRARNYSKVISLLEPLVLEYKESFDFFFVLGTACLYVEDIGGADAYYKSARRLRPENCEILKAQGVLNLRLGNVTRALELYLHVLDLNPGDAVATGALEFIRRNSNPGKMEEKVRSGSLKKFYPKTGLHPAIVPSCIIVLAICAMGVLFVNNYKTLLGLNGARGVDLSAYEPSEEDLKNPLSKNLINNDYKYFLTIEQVNEYRVNARSFFEKKRDNEARRYINMILRSNASDSIKSYVNGIAKYLEEPRFDTITDNYTLKQVLEDVYQYENCWVVWSGRVSNVEENEKIYKCNFLVGYENLDRIDGIVTLVFEQPVSISNEKPIEVLARITVTEDGELILRGRAIHQPL